MPVIDYDIPKIYKIGECALFRVLIGDSPINDDSLFQLRVFPGGGDSGDGDAAEHQPGDLLRHSPHVTGVCVAGAVARTHSQGNYNIIQEEYSSQTNQQIDLKIDILLSVTLFIFIKGF